MAKRGEKENGKKAKTNECGVAGREKRGDEENRSILSKKIEAHIVWGRQKEKRKRLKRGRGAGRKIEGKR